MTRTCFFCKGICALKLLRAALTIHWVTYYTIRVESKQGDSAMNMGPLLLVLLAALYQCCRSYCAPDRLLARQAKVMTKQLPYGVKLAELQRFTSMVPFLPLSAPHEQ